MEYLWEIGETGWIAGLRVRTVLHCGMGGKNSGYVGSLEEGIGVYHPHYLRSHLGYSTYLAIYPFPLESVVLRLQQLANTVLADDCYLPIP